MVWFRTMKTPSLPEPGDRVVGPFPTEHVFVGPAREPRLLSDDLHDTSTCYAIALALHQAWAVGSQEPS